MKENSTRIPKYLNIAFLGILNYQNKTENPVDLKVKANQDRRTNDRHSGQGSLSSQDIIKTAFSGVVMVHCGNTWGSGVVIDTEGCLIATCSHVIQDSYNILTVTERKTLSRHLTSTKEVTISWNCPNSVHYEAQVLSATQEGCPLDFALLKAQPNPQFRSLKPRLVANASQIKSSDFSKLLYTKGEEICVAGFPLFASHLNTGPSVVSGVISSIAYIDQQSVLLQSTAAVHRGASGGALVSMETGELLGMVTCHTNDANLSSTFPRVNFSIPSDLLYKLVSAVTNGTFEETLQGLVSDQMDSIWQLRKTEKSNITSKL